MSKRKARSEAEREALMWRDFHEAALRAQLSGHAGRRRKTLEELVAIEAWREMHAGARR
jgi:hypothetical protein